MVAAIEGVYVAIEVVDTRIKQWQTCAELWKLADNQINAALIIGSSVQDWRGLDPAKLAGELVVNGEVLVRGEGAHSVGDPMHLVHWTVMVFVEPGAEVVGRFEGVGEAKVSFPV
ncbi:hypothetical protein A8C75_17705 [Marinobacterium aestuarii]|uniref:Uncharacterized protein n=1 Tax=Marinobacterium aestuarii TaxID=1821621 RepID=A0A1A9F1U0_9GAMM|nr:hypothetical protein A8C75_17705 [Marinobacterium aestuarii]